MLHAKLLIPRHMRAAWTPALEAACAEAGLTVTFDADLAPDQADYVIYAPRAGEDFAPYTRAKAVLGLWAGVESVVANPTLTQPYARMVDEGLTEGMVEWVTGHVLRHHLDLDRYITQSAPDWTQIAPPLARSRRVGILGLGELGRAAAAALAALNFDVSGWSQSQKELQGVMCLSGPDGLQRLLESSQILVLLLPLTPATESLLNAKTLARLPQGAVILNPGRGGLIDDDALLAALDSGHIAHATLDTFRTEPLPDTHPYWTHPKVTVTPHIASATRPETAARVIAENIRRSEAGLPLRHQIDKTRGY